MLEQLTDWLVFNVFGFEADLAFSGVLHFFIYETVKIGLLLLLVTHLMGAINLVFPIEKVRKLISSGKLRGVEYPAASLFGAVTPFCSCSSIPLFIGFLQGGIPIGVTFSFLITSPLVNEIALALFLAAFGVKVTLIYALSGILLGTVLGWILGRFDLEKHLESWVRDLAKNKANDGQQSALSIRDQVRHVSRDAMGIIKTIAPYVLAGVAIGGRDTRIPSDWILRVLHGRGCRYLVRSTFCTHRSPYVRQCVCRHPHHAGPRGQRHPFGNGHSVYDGCSWSVSS